MPSTSCGSTQGAFLPGPFFLHCIFSSRRASFSVPAYPLSPRGSRCCPRPCSVPFDMYHLHAHTPWFPLQAPKLCLWPFSGCRNLLSCLHAGQAGGAWASTPPGADFSQWPASLPPRGTALRCALHSLPEVPQEGAHSSHLPITVPSADSLLFSHSCSALSVSRDHHLKKVLLRNLFQAPAQGNPA